MKKFVKKSALATACCALMLAAPLALAQPAAASDGPKTPEEAAACRNVVGSLLGGFGAALGSAVCVVQPSDGGRNSE
ncbi:hypothetical protein KV557_35565 [Kitasatospora aureofaciens]|uniref:hypothetical protein n=1 Tax=Kitasatospora aureofaciens TaxID=1894 RepID=UPI001C481D89|nr:hypothetical protein [Kitasatospora aureofaciens]MBV6702362.1 hypothetical protein [Kitasatospora aureofaciens]